MNCLYGINNCFYLSIIEFYTLLIDHKIKISEVREIVQWVGCFPCTELTWLWSPASNIFLRLTKDCWPKTWNSICIFLFIWLCWTEVKRANPLAFIMVNHQIFSHKLWSRLHWFNSLRFKGFATDRRPQFLDYECLFRELE